MRTEFARAGDAALHDAAQFGSKAAGLARLPEGWTPKFFAVAVGALTRLPRPRLRESIAQELSALDSCADGLVVRSSAVEEGLQERGSFDSMLCGADTDEIVNTLIALFEHCPRDSQGRLGFVVQARVLDAARGHLSNERRVSSDRRGWLCEVELPVAADESAFRFRIDSDTRSADGLSCDNVDKLESVFRWVARQVSTRGPERLHLEWVWDGARVWIVQQDPDSTPAGPPPGSAWAETAHEEVGRPLAIFTEAAKAIDSSFPKVRHVATLASAGLPFGDVRVLAGGRIIEALARGAVPPEVDRDLDILIEHPVVVRTDLSTSAERAMLMSKRTDTCRTKDELVKFLVSTATAHVEAGHPSTELAFLAHRFLPAIAGAFARTRPGQSRVQVDATWGLPDSLFYYPHDTYTIDTDRESVARHLRCKVDYIDVDASGKWTPRPAGSPWDWRASLTVDAAIEVAALTRRLVEFVGEELEIMFFVGRTRKGDSWCLPWFFTPVEHHGHGPVESSRSFYVGDRRRITNASDIARLEAEIANNPESKPIITLRPEVKLLRDKQFVAEVAAVATAHALPVELEGSVLSHVYYLLDKDGVAVRVVDLYRKREPRRTFGKLVRDLVPVKIERRGELADIYHPTADELIPLVKSKLVEEALEHYWAESPLEAKEELADLLEIIRTAARVQGLQLQDVETAAARKREKRGGFDDGVVLVETRDAVPRDDARSLLDDPPRGDRLRASGRRPVRLPSRRITLPLVPPAGWERGMPHVVPLDATDEVVLTYGGDEVLLEVRPRTPEFDRGQLQLDLPASLQGDSEIPGVDDD